MPSENDFVLVKLQKHYTLVTLGVKGVSVNKGVLQKDLEEFLGEFFWKGLEDFHENPSEGILWKSIGFYSILFNFFAETPLRYFCQKI